MSYKPLSKEEIKTVSLNNIFLRPGKRKQCNNSIINETACILTGMTLYKTTNTENYACFIIIYFIGEFFFFYI